MRYVIAGKSDSYWFYIRRNKYKHYKDVRYMRDIGQISDISEDDIVVLLYGWWAKHWAISFLKDILKVYPTINFEYLDGPFGEEKRKDLKSESISNRYDLLDL